MPPIQPSVSLQGSFLKSIKVEPTANGTILLVTATVSDSIRHGRLGDQLPTIGLRIPPGVQACDVQSFLESLQGTHGPMTMAIDVLNDMKLSAAELKGLSRTAGHVVQMLSISADLRLVKRFLGEAMDYDPTRAFDIQSSTVQDAGGRPVCDMVRLPSRAEYVGYIPFRFGRTRSIRGDEMCHAGEAAGRAETRIKAVLNALIDENVITAQHQIAVASKFSLDCLKMDILTLGYCLYWFL